MYDILIVGGGPAGLTAAIYARRAGRSVLVLEGAGLGGQIISSPLVENYPGISAISGMEYSDVLSRQAAALGAETAMRQVRKAERTREGFLVSAGKRGYEGRALILATGAKHRHLGLAGEEAMIGRGVSYCATCDGSFFAGKAVAVVGGGDSALQTAVYLSGICDRVSLIHRRGQFRGAQALVEQVRSRENVALRLYRTVEALEGDGRLSGLVLKDARTGGVERLAVDGLFVAVGQAPDNAPFAGLARLDENGFFCAGEDCRTQTPGVFVAGDCRAKGLRQLTTAVSDGSVAATAACLFLEEGYAHAV